MVLSIILPHSELGGRRICPSGRPYEIMCAPLPFAAVEDLEIVAGVGGEEAGDVAKALG